MKLIIMCIVLTLFAASLVLNIILTIMLLRQRKPKKNAVLVKKRAEISKPQAAEVYVGNANPEADDMQLFKTENTRQLSLDEAWEPYNQTVVELTDLEYETTEKILVGNGLVDIGSSSVIGSRACQQDALRTMMFGGSEPGKCQCVMGVLCDGMGGMEGGEIASNIAVDRMIEFAQNVVRDYPAFFRTTIEKINKEITELCDVNGRRIRAGSTLTCAMVNQDNLFWCTVGDSRIYLYRDGQMKQLNTEHNYKTMVNEMLRTGQMKPEEIDPNENPEALTSYLGMGQTCQVDGNLSPVKLKAGDTIVQCSDGLYRSLSDKELAEILQQLPDLNIAAEAMTSMAVTIPGTHDNTSVILMRYKGTA